MLHLFRKRFLKVNKRKAKRLRVGFFKETGYILHWEAKEPDEKIWEKFIDLVENHGMYFGGSVSDFSGNGILSGKPYQTLPETVLKPFLKELQNEIPMKCIKTHGPFDLNNTPKKTLEMIEETLIDDTQFVSHIIETVDTIKKTPIK